VPVYNVEEYLNRCVDSIINQTYKNLEIILVDDGSLDNCGLICDEYAKKDPRIKVIHKNNGGLSDARNAGLKIASGEWISFIDSDDWIESNMYEVLLNLAKKYDAQISVGGVSDEIFENGEIITVKTTEKAGTSPYVLSCTQAMQKYFLGSWAAWDKIYHKSIFKNIQFPVGEINEDEAIVLQILENASNISYTNQVFYHYIRRPQSITTTSFHPKKLDWCKHCKQNLDYIINKYPDLIPLARKRYISSLMWALNNMTYNTKEFKIPIEKIRQELKNNLCFLNGFSFKERFRAFLQVYFYYIYAFFVRFLKKHYS
jgi:glycosyltransferase involved in cell wall biosynthesis